jgi:glycosyltransferase involved in cell wall biosynthesis
MISVVIPNYNYGRFLAQAITSASDADEIIVVDDGSTDDSVKIAEGLGVKLIKQQNRGVSAARNRGSTEAKGDFIAYLDADDYFLPGAIEAYKDAFDADIGLCTISMREVDLNGNELSLCRKQPLGWIDGISLMAVVSGSSLCVRRDAFQQVKFDEDRRIHPSEDWDFVYRLSQKYAVKAVDEILVCWRNHGNNAHLRIQHTERSMLAVYEKIFRERTTGRRRSYANLHSIVAGSYLHSRDYRRFMGSAVKSVFYDPRVILSRLKGPRLSKFIKPSPPMSIS